MTSHEIRQQFIDFFVKKHGHSFVPSSPVVPLDDPTLLFTNAGMNQFKPIFLGQEKRSYTRAANTQKCIRAGGKHNDLDDVGRSRRHHTFFEMLGNWSFGDYFKRGAIEMAWELLTQVWKLDPTRLHVSCFEGYEAAGIPRDTEAANIWKEVARLPDDHIHYFGKDNFWQMGDTGPCGPCTEIYIDRTPDKTGGPLVNGSDPRVMEIWNLVFIQYDCDANGKLTTLPAQHVDTGMGLERICQVLQGKEDNFAIDLWTPLFDRISQISNLKYTGQFPKTNAADPVAESANPQLRHDIAFRVVADHIRCLTFALTDGAVPSNEGRGYVLRRILRRAVRFGRQHLGLKGPFLHKLVPVVVESMGATFPELRHDPSRVANLILEEEQSFGRTLDRGIDTWWMFAAQALRQALYTTGSPGETRNVMFNHAGSRREGEPRSTTHADDIVHLTLVDDRESIEVYRGKWQDIPPEIFPQITSRPPCISAEGAFKLHDTYGFPIDLTRIMAEERGFEVDIAGYEKLMEEARELARSGGRTENTRLSTLPPDALAQLAQANVKPTDDKPKFSHEPIQAKVMAIWNGDDLGLAPADVLEDEELAIILDRTNFYAEMGGQVGDSGELRAASGAVFDVQTTKVTGGFVLHIGRIRSGCLHVTDTVTAKVASERQQTEKNHTSTHLANWALREVLGDDVQQKGSLVDPEKLRFDFSHGKAMSDDEISRVESLVSQSVQKELPVYAEEAPQEKALKIHGLRAVFGEKYPPMVRVVSIGVPVKDLLANPSNPKWRQYSIEFCGGTHLSNSSQAGNFAVIAEESVSKGIRRIIALTGDSAAKANASATEIDRIIESGKSAKDAQVQPVIAQLTQAISGTVPLRAKRRAQAAIAEFQQRHKAFEKANKAAPSASVDVSSISSGLIAQATPLGPGKLIVGQIPDAPTDQVLAVVDSLKKKAGSYAIFIASVLDGRIAFVCAVSDDLIAKGLKAGDWLREAAKAAGGKGGGRPQLAQGSGSEPAKLHDALQAARDYAARSVTSA